jgi:hypothetical protein
MNRQDQKAHSSAKKCVRTKRVVSSVIAAVVFTLLIQPVTAAEEWALTEDGGQAVGLADTGKAPCQLPLQGERRPLRANWLIKNHFARAAPLA